MADNNSNGSNDSSADEQDSAYQPKVRPKEERDQADEPETDETEDDGGIDQYESKKEPGSRVRVAKARDQESTSKSEGEDASDGPSRRAVDVSNASDDDQEAEDEQEEPQQDADQTDTESKSQSADESSPQADDAASAQAESPSPTRETVRETPVSGDDADERGSTDQSVESTDERITDDGPDADEMPGMEEMGGGLGDEVDATTDDFEALLNQQGEASVPQRREYSSGDRIEGEVLEIGERNIFVQLDPQTEGIAHRRDIETEDGELTVDVGEQAEFYVTEVTEDEVYLGLQLQGDQGSMDAIQDAHDSGVPVEGKVTGTNKGGFEVEIHGVEAFCPISEIELGYTEDKEPHVGARYRFKVQEVRDGVVVSRAELLREERREKAEKTLENLEEGDTVEGVVTRIEGFGAFVDIGGVEGLIHRSELSHRHIDHPGDIFNEGDEVEVEVLEIGEEERDDGTKKPRISLSRKAKETDPWETINDEFAVGETVDGEVTRNAPFGAFVQIADGVEGLVHVSEMSWTEHVRTPDEIVEPGDKVTVEVQDIDIPRRRISLSIKGAQGHPWDEAGDRYAEGMEVTGTIENIEDFGAFVKLSDGITALIPRSEMDLPQGVAPHRKYDPGEEVTARVLNIDVDERKMALTDKSADEPERMGAEIEDESDEVDSADDAADGDEGRSNPADRGDEGGFGTLGDVIGDQLQNEE
jgi:small subunit ribosomal protein S1